MACFFGNVSFQGFVSIHRKLPVGAKIVELRINGLALYPFASGYRCFVRPLLLMLKRIIEPAVSKSGMGEPQANRRHWAWED